MKIISGKYKGRVLDGFELKGTRPTMDRVKESLFAMIQNYIFDSIVLDLFSGSGNLGIEALSEGAKFSYFVDSNKKAYQTIKDNLEKIGENNYKIIGMDYLKALDYFYNEKIKFDIIFLDSPYNTDYVKKSLEKIEQYNLLKDKGIIVCESNSLDKITSPDCYQLKKEKKYGDKFIVLLEKI